MNDDCLFPSPLTHPPTLLSSRPPPPYFLLLPADPTNVSKVTAYIRGRALRSDRANEEEGAGKEGEGDSDNLQVIVISLKDAFYEHASALVGVFRDQAANSSRTMTLDVDQFPQD